MNGDVWVCVEQDAEGVTDLSRQCLACGRNIARQSGVPLAALLLGSNVQPLAAQMSEEDVDRVLVAEDPRLKCYVPSVYEKVILSAVHTHSPSVLLFPASTQGNDLASAVAIASGAGCVLDCCRIEVSPHGLTGKRMEFNGKVLSSYASPAAKLRVFTAVDGIAEVTPAASEKAATISSLPVPLNENDLVTQVINREVAARTVNLKEARVIVAAGAGVGNRENFKLVEELARVMGGEIGASRAAVDAGWTTLDRQIGQTGVTVRPDLYIACGISGAIQHRVGMMDSKRIVAINTDLNAPIFRFSHYRIVADIADVIPKLIELWRKT